MKILIIGSGLVGFAAAIAFQKQGHQCVLFDKLNPVQVLSRGGDGFIQFGDIGGSVALASNSLRLLRDLGVLDEVLANSSPSRLVHYHKIDGSSPIVLELELVGSRLEDDKTFQCAQQIMRSKLHNILARAAQKAGATIYVDKYFVKLEQSEDSVRAEFKDGTVVEGDLLIGADGMHSPVRMQLFGDSCKAKFSGTIGYIGVVNYKEHGIQFDETIAFYIDRAKKRVITVFRVTDEIATLQASVINSVADENEEYRSYADLPAHAQRLADTLEEWGVPAKVSTMMRKAFRISPANLYELPDLAAYHKGRVVLVGDSAHGMLPNAGLGLGTGLDDVGTLAELFRQLPDTTATTAALQRTLRLYSEIRAPRAAKNAAFSRTMADQNYSTLFGANGSHFVHRLFVNAMNADWFRPYKAPEVYSQVVELQISSDKKALR
ncbi:hypothetical protein HDU84_008917 [Entophlyctis sp. JEL0112]|nr:hypothetical protein HDU84_008917 [Entophlyctis sp. JEL0112]